jgi:arsenite methyltransferase
VFQAGLGTAFSDFDLLSGLDYHQRWTPGPKITKGRGVIVDQDEIKRMVRRRWATRAGEVAGGRADGDPTARVRRYYSQTELDGMPDQVSALAQGCGDPTAIAGLASGEVVLDLGAGGGIDCFLAARQVGPSGRVIGVDICPEILDLAAKNAEMAGLEQIEFRLDDIELLSLESESVDVVISNCVVCLTPDKQAVFREAFRVLRPGGRMCISDQIREDGRAYDGDNPVSDWMKRMAGAPERTPYLAMISAAGFDSVEIVQEERRERYPGDPEELLSVKVLAFKAKDG